MSNVEPVKMINSAGNESAKDRIHDHGTNRNEHAGRLVFRKIPNKPAKKGGIKRKSSRADFFDLFHCSRLDVVIFFSFETVSLKISMTSNTS